MLVIMNRLRLAAIPALAVLVLVTGCAAPAREPGGSPSIDVSATDTLTDEPVRAVVRGLPAGSEVTLWARRHDDLGRAWLGYGVFTADAAGVVDLGVSAPSAGTYSGVDPMGLFWSVRLADGTAPIPASPVAADPAVQVTLAAQVDGAVVTERALIRRTAAPGVTSRPVRETGLVGTLHLPPGPGPHPGVVLLTGSDGGIPDYGMGGLLASRGFAVLALAYFGTDGVPPELVRIPLEYFERGFDWLTGLPEVGDGQVGVVGPSRGGELALLLGATFPKVGAVVSYVGSGVGYGGIPRAGGFGPTAPPAWTFRGRDMPFVSPALDTGRYWLPSLLGQPVTDLAGTWPEIQAAGPAAIEAATIPVERIAGPVLLLSGEADGLWPSTRLSDLALRRMESHGHAASHAHVSYPGAGHLFIGSPYGWPFPTTLPLPPLGQVRFGGSPEGNARAAADSWPRMLAILRQGLPG